MHRDPGFPGGSVARRDSFNRNANLYQEGRPPYPERVFTFMEELGAFRHAPHILEIGPGTGQATVELLRRGARVDAIELGAHLAAGLRARVPDERLRIIVGDVQTVPFPASAYDVVAAATVFHWLDTARLLPRLASIIRPGGWLIVWWNVFGDPHVTTPFRKRVDGIFRDRHPAEWRPLDELPRAMRVEDRIAELEAGGWFRVARHELIRWTCRMTPAQERSLFATFPAIAGLPDVARSAILDEIETATAALAVEGAIDDPFVTAIYAAQPTLGD